MKYFFGIIFSCFLFYNFPLSGQVANKSAVSFDTTFSDGQKKIEKDSANYRWSWEYDTKEKLLYYHCYVDYGNTYDYSASYFPNGKLMSMDSIYTTEKSRKGKGAVFDSLGRVTYRYNEEYLPPLPNGANGSDGDETNDPEVKYEWHFENKLLVQEGASYMNCDMCGDVPVGEWKFYENGKLIRTEKYPSWQTVYKKEYSGGNKNK